MSLPSSSYIPSLDGLRGISILLVFVAHIGFEKIVPGGLGVTIFFFISGYLITSLLISEINNTGSIHFKLFFIRRLMRLYPPLLFMICLFYLYLFFTNQGINVYEVLASLFYYENYYFYYHPDPAHSSDICKVLWSLVVEEHFYLVFPALFWLIYKSPKALMTMLIVLLFVPLVFRLWGIMMYGSTGDITERYTYLLTHTRFDSIIYGCLASVLLHIYNSAVYVKIISNKWVFAAAALTIVACLVVRNGAFRNTIRYSIQGLSLLVVIPAVVNIPIYQNLRTLLSNRALVFVGKLSYSIYLTHMTAIGSLAFIRKNGHPLLFYVLVILLTAALSVFSYQFIEKPFAKLRTRYRAKERLTLA
ncbi:acyltransferase [Mucilaginibacter sp. PAMB04274]|uniref:acyltransferase family protein n=1 Tax=Mucilaginibacter sp. PAMB04274 TaxID=3138568 RepID=UPI0031F71D3F